MRNTGSTDRPLRLAALGLVLALVATAGLAKGPSAEELQQQIDELRAELAELRAEQAVAKRVEEMERRLLILAEEVEKLRIGEAAAEADGSDYGLGPAASKVYRTERGVSLGGYGELLYQRFDDSRDDGTDSGKTDTFDLLRGVVYFGYKFDDRFVLNTEIEYEHAATSESGEVAVEFAYLDFLWREAVNLRGGLLLLPMGWINELHEPTVFLGANRPESERRILPTTWRENGFGLFGDLGQLTYRAYVVNGLDASGFTAGGLRGGRQKGSKAKAEDLAVTARLDYEGIPSLKAGISLYYGGSGQGIEDTSGRSIDATTTLFDLHLDWRWRGLELRGLATRATVDDVARLNRTLGLMGDRSIGEELEGYYLQAGYDLLGGRHGSHSLIPFVRWERLNTQEEVPEGWSSDPANDQQILTLGLSYKPIEQVVLKIDYEDFDNEADTGVDRFNALLGWVF